MKNYFYLIGLLVLLASCKKENTNFNNIKDKTFKVDFNVNTLSQIVIDFPNQKSTSSNLKSSLNSSENEINKGISVLYYLIFDQNGKLLHFTKQDSTGNPNFSKFSIDLPIGKYKIGVVGSSHCYPSNPSKNHIFAARDLPNVKIDFLETVSADGYCIKETFANTPLDFEVTSNNSTTYPVNLKRITSQLDLIIEDEIPENASRIEFLIPSVLFYSPFGVQDLNSTEKYSFSIKDSVNKTNVKISIPIFYGINNENNSKLLTLRIFDSSNSIITTRIVENIRFEKNKITQLKGTLFNATSGETFSLNFIDEFDGIIDIPF